MYIKHIDNGPRRNLLRQNNLLLAQMPPKSKIYMNIILHIISYIQSAEYRK